MAGKNRSKKNGNAVLGFEAKLWLAADKLRNNMDAAEYKHVVLGLIFLKYISDTFEQHRTKLLSGKGEYAGANPEDKDEYKAENVFWVPKEARWSHLQGKAKQPTIGKLVDDAMVAIERDNPRLKGVLPKDYARPALDKHRLGELIDLIGTIALVQSFQPSSPALLSEGEGSEPAGVREVKGNGAHYRGGYEFSGLIERARELRKKETHAEELLWQLLRNRQLYGAKFRRQHQFGDYICAEAMLVIECDGESHNSEKRRQHDAKRDAYLKAQGLTVLRFSNDTVLNDSRAVLEKIATHLPSTSGRRAGDEGGQNTGGPAMSGQDNETSSHRSVDLLGRVYEYFLTMFASAEGKNGGQFYTPRCVVQVLVEMLAPYKGRVYDPCCGSGGMFVQSEKFVEAHGGRIGDISIYGQESNSTTRRLAVMNLALRGIEADLGPEHADTFRRDLHPDLRADYILANPPFNDSDWFRKDDDVRWQFGVPPKGNANFAWVQHFIHHLAPGGAGTSGGMAGFVLANGSMSSNQSGEGEIRRAIVEADLVDCMVALPGQLFYSTQIPVCLWFLTRSKSADAKRGFRDRKKQTLFIDARKLGSMIDRVHRDLTNENIQKIVTTYHAWRSAPPPPPSPAGRRAGDEGAAGLGRRAGDEGAAGLGRRAENEGAPGLYVDIPGFCKSATTSEIAQHGYVLTPGRYVGAEEIEDDGEPFDQKMKRLVAELNAQFAESPKLEKAIKLNLKGLGYG
jgi:type I restriction-modification system DNA methylase subunit